MGLSSDGGQDIGTSPKLGKAAKPGRMTISTPNFGTVNLGKKATKQLAVADYQSRMNQEMMDKQTEANRTNQITPWGEVNWSQGDDGTWTQTTTLSPDQQAALDAQQRIQSGLSGTAEGMLGSIGDKYSSEMNWDQFGDPAAAVSGPGMGDFRTYGAGPEFQKAGPLNMDQLLSTGNATGYAASGGASGVERAKEYDLQKQLDLSNLTDMPEADAATRQRVEDALYQRFQSRLDPQWEQKRNQNLDRLYAMGAREGDQLFGQQTSNLARDENDAYNNAMWQSIVGGGEEMQRLFDMGMNARKQSFDEALQGGQFTNDALMNQFQQGAFNAGEANKVGVANARNATDAGIATSRNLTDASIASAGNRTNLAGLGLDYDLRSADQNNQWSQQGWDNDRTGADQWNELVQTVYGNERQGWQDQNTVRNQQIEEALRQRNQPLNELMALLTGQQVGMPTFNGTPNSTAGAAEAGDYYGAFTDNQARQDAAKAQQMQMISQLGGAAMGMFSFSDPELKTNVEHVGETPAGFNVYDYDIFGHRERGVMADEVPPEWTARHPSGYLMVDYSRVR